MKSNGTAIRTFCYLSDATIAYFLVLLNGKDGEPYNVGNPDCEISIIDLAHRLVGLFPSKGLKVVRIENQNLNYLKSEVTRNCPDLSKINKLGWMPNTDINEGFIKTIMSYE
jgi:nucleoside-diphosphate-sugar epimerase